MRDLFRRLKVSGINIDISTFSKAIALRFWVRTHFETRFLTIGDRNRGNVLTHFGTAIVKKKI